MKTAAITDNGIAIEVLEWLSSAHGIQELKLALSLLALIPGAAVIVAGINAALPEVQALATLELGVLNAGLMDGSIVADGQGGFVPSSNSHYDPATGRFLSGPFSE